MKPSDEFEQRRKSRAIITAFALVGLVVLVFAITYVRMKHGG